MLRRVSTSPADSSVILSCYKLRIIDSFLQSLTSLTVIHDSILGEAVEFFQSASQILDRAVANNVALAPLPQKSLSNIAETSGTGGTVREGAVSDDPLNASVSWVPGSLERRLNRGQDIELHFSSKNSEEENGAIQMTFQSPTPGFKGDALSSKQSLKFSSAMHLICHMLREPLFNELRTKQVSAALSCNTMQPI